MIEDLTMLANLPAVDAEALERAKAESDKAAASETMPPPKHQREDVGGAADSDTARLARRGQDPPAQVPPGEQDS